MKNQKIHISSLFGLAFLFFFGCATDKPNFGPPADWEGSVVRWWRADTDTSKKFRDLEKLESMNVTGGEMTYFTLESLAYDSEETKERLIWAVKQSLIRLIRNEPEVVDSLFERFVTPKIRSAVLSPDEISSDISRFKKEGYRLIQNNYQEPRMALTLGEDVPVIFPDSLQDKQIGGSVRTQVYVNAKGEPEAIELLEGVHPVLNDIAMKATTKMRWRPAYLMRQGNWRPIPSWVRFTLNFVVPPE